MKEFPPKIKFKFPWRNYQQRVLSELESHLDDNHLHIVAPPGSGKTILGLEVALRINKPCLILVPTLAIRNQWIQRFVELFIQVEEIPDWISNDIKNPKFLTVATYQALHAACADNTIEEHDDEEENNDNGHEDYAVNEKTQEVINAFQLVNLGLIVVDEAHHLKNAWWQSLDKLKEAINPTVVGLTATPPYDVSYAEWQRYINLNGPVDAEISIPELVVEGDLCPHHDFVLLSHPTYEEKQKIYEYRERIQKLFEEVKLDTDLVDAIENHPIIQNPLKHQYWIYSNIEYYSASLIFLNAVGKVVSPEHLEIIGDKNYVIPELTYDWIEIILTFYLYKDPDNFEIYVLHQEKLIKKLKRYGVVERHSINFIYNRKVNNYLSSSISKLQSIDEIVDFEHQQLQQDLRMVILTDYIRKEYLVDALENTLELNKIGVLPIFEKLRRTNNKSIKIGVLTGSLIIIPESALAIFNKITIKKGIDRVSITPISFDTSYLIVEVNHQLKHQMVGIITQIFQQGEIEVLVGTKSLLGEGWDAPAINALILASFVGSYVSSNQMRGRAIRTQRKNSDKTGNIWHLACVDPTSQDGGNDIKILKRRFKTFVGLSNGEGIENGIDRLSIPKTLNSYDEITSFNNLMMANAAERHSLKNRWKIALKTGVNLVEEIKIPFAGDSSYNAVKSLYYDKTIKNLIGVLTSGFIGFGLDAMKGLLKNLRDIRTVKDLTYWFAFTGVIGVLFFGKNTYLAAKTYIKYRDISKDVHNIAEALLSTLINIGIIKTNYESLAIVTKTDNQGAIYCHLEGGSTFEKSTFILALQELINSIDNPKYVIIRKSYFLKVFSQKDYHAVPDLIGRRKEYAIDFRNQWMKQVGSCELIFTRTIAGRKMLLRSRLLSLSAQLEEEKVERVNKWR